MSFGPPPDRSNSSLSVTGEHLHTSASVTPPKKTYKYKRIAGGSNIDETLFSSHRDQQLSRPGSAKRSTHRNATGDHPAHPPRTNSSMSTTPPIKSALSVNATKRPQSRSGYRVKYAKSYVDETLFGPKLEAPSFEAPWEDKEDKKKGAPLFWSPPVPGSLACTPAPDEGFRPGSAASRPSSAASRKRPPTPTNSTKPPWK